MTAIIIVISLALYVMFAILVGHWLGKIGERYPPVEDVCRHKTQSSHRWLDEYRDGLD